MEIWSVGFCGGRKTGEPREKLSEQGENQQQNPGHIDGRRGLSPLLHPCFQNELYFGCLVGLENFVSFLSFLTCRLEF